MKIHFRIAALALVMGMIFLYWTASAQESVSESEKVEFSKNMLLPSPGEIFVAVDKLGPVDWSEAASYDKRYDYQDNALRALNLGIRAADGFLAIQEKDKKKLGRMISIILTLAEELLVSETILDKGQQFEEMAKQDRWDEMRNELDKLRDDIMAEMERLGDRDIALLVSAGGWLEGLRATSGVLADNYRDKASSILYQPRLVDYFLEQTSHMSAKTKSQPMVVALMTRLSEIKVLIDVGYKNPVPQANVIRLNEISSNLVQAMERG